MPATQGNKSDGVEASEREKREDLERWERYRRSGEAVPHETVRQWLTDIAQSENKR
jgi:predicted transcriptional regulator